MDRGAWLEPLRQRHAAALALLGFALMLGACTKCDVPAWQHSSTGDAPVACHDSPAPQ